MIESETLWELRSIGASRWYQTKFAAHSKPVSDSLGNDVLHGGMRMLLTIVSAIQHNLICIV